MHTLTRQKSDIKIVWKWIPCTWGSLTLEIQLVAIVLRQGLFKITSLQLSTDSTSAKPFSLIN